MKKKYILAVLFFWLTLASVRAEPSVIFPAGAEREHFIYYFDNLEQVEYCDSVLNLAREELSAFLGQTISYKPSVYMLNDLPRFEKIVQGVFPDWGAAAALPRAKLIAIKSPDHFKLGKPLGELLRHEYAHLALASRVGNRKIPRWFNEGSAMVFSSEWGWSENMAMSKAAVFNEFLDLREIDDLNRFKDNKAQLAYAQSYWAVRYLQDEYGAQAITIFLDEIAGGSLIDEALLAAVGSNYSDFDREYRTFLATKFNILTFYVDTMYFWFALAIILIIGGLMKYKQRRKFYEKWENEEKLQSTDFDYGDPDNPEQIDDEDRPWES